MKLIPVAGFAWVAAMAQTPLSLGDAVKTALEKHPSLAVAAAQIDAAGSRIEQARAAKGPRVGWMESFQSSNNPVFAFGSLLNQRRFAEANFRIDSLNSPGFVNNFQTMVTAGQTIYDGGAVKAQVRVAEVGRELSVEQRRALQMQRIAVVAQRYHAVWLGSEAGKTALAAEKSALADLERAESVRAAGMSTDADVLSIRVHLAAMREQTLDRRQDIRIARAALNEAMGVPIETEFELTTPLAGMTKTPVAKTVAASRPDLRQAELQRQASEAQGAAARSALYPQIALNGVFEADRGRFITQAGANWFAGVTVSWNLFNGGVDRRRIDETAQLTTAARAGERQAAQAAQLELRQAGAALAAASERIGVAEAGVEYARESLRIMKNRFNAGLTTVHELLRNETALVEAETRRLRARYDQRVAAVLVELAAGTLTEASDVLQ